MRRPLARVVRRGFTVLALGVALWCLCGAIHRTGWPAGAFVAWADAPIKVLNNAHAATFGREMRFSLEVESEHPIQSVVLAYRTSDTGGTTVETMSVVPDTSLRLEFVHEMSRRYVRPFVQVSYWWTIVDASEARLVTEPQQFTYADDRYEWQTLGGDRANVHWYEGTVQVAQQSLDVTTKALNRAQEEIGTGEDARRASSTGVVDVYLYANNGLTLHVDPLSKRNL